MQIASLTSTGIETMAADIIGVSKVTACGSYGPHIRSHILFIQEEQGDIRTAIFKP